MVTYLAMFVLASCSQPKRKPRGLCEDVGRVPTPRRESPCVCCELEVAHWLYVLPYVYVCKELSQTFSLNPT